MSAFVFRTRSSHVRTYESCNRKWFLNEVCGLPDKDTPAKSFGTEMHLILENWLRDAKQPGKTPEAMAAKRSIHLLPAPGTGLLVEHKIERVLADGTIYTGAIDLVDMRPGEQLSKGVRLYDHKSTANLSYAKTADELSRDVSAVFYAMEVRRLTRESGREEHETRGRWNYVARLGAAAAMPVEFTIRGTDQRERWAMTLGSVGVMRKHAEQKPKWQEVTPNYDACGNFGGCQFRAQCALAKARSGTVNDTVNNAPEGRKENAMGLLDDLKNKVSIGQGVAAPSAPPPQQPTQVAEVKPAPSGSVSPLQALLARKKAPTVAAIVAAQPTPIEEPSDVAGEQEAVDGDGGLEEGMSVGINPPEAPPADLLKDTVEKKKKAKRTKTIDAPALVKSDDLIGSPEMQRALEADAAKLEQLMAKPQQPDPTWDTVVGSLGKSESRPIEVPITDVDPDAPTGTEFRKVSDIVASLRKRAEAMSIGTGNNYPNPAEANTLFVTANMLERGEL